MSGLNLPQQIVGSVRQLGQMLSEPVSIELLTNPPTNENIGLSITRPWGLPYPVGIAGKLTAIGPFRLAGDAPDGLVLSNGSPAVRPVRVYHRGTGELIAEVTSAADGTWQVAGLSDAVDLDVQIMGTQTGERDVLIPKVRAS